MWRGQEQRGWTSGRSGGSGSWSNKGSGGAGSGSKSRSDAITWRKDVDNENQETLKKGEEAEVNSPMKDKLATGGTQMNEKVKKSLEFEVSADEQANDMVLDKVEGGLKVGHSTMQETAGGWNTVMYSRMFGRRRRRGTIIRNHHASSVGSIERNRTNLFWSLRLD